jgi:hypothetical protein
MQISSQKIANVCTFEEIISLPDREYSAEHNMTVLAAIRLLGEQADKEGNWHRSYGALILRATTLLSHAKTIAQSEHVKFLASYHVRLLSHLVVTLKRESGVWRPD